MIIREHGYARLNDSDDINHRLAYHYESKLEIAKEVAMSIQDGETVMIESGSCCALAAAEIARTKKDVTLITQIQPLLRIIFVNRARFGSSF